MPGRIPVRQPVFHDQPHRHTHRSERIVTVRKRQIAQVRLEIRVALPAAVLAICDPQNPRPAADQVAQIVQTAHHRPQPRRTVAALRAGAVFVVPAAFEDLRLRQILGPCDPLRLVRSVSTGFWHVDTLQRRPLVGYIDMFSPPPLANYCNGAIVSFNIVIV